VSHVELVSTMGTEISLHVRTPAPAERMRKVVVAVTARLRAIDETFSPWRSDSWVSRLIRGSLAATDCPEEVRHVLRVAEELEELTNGYFSPYWRRIPHGDPGPDPTGLVKGWAAQQASKVLMSHELPDHVVNAAGDVVVSGQSTPGDPASVWRIGISDPSRPRELVGVVELDQSASRWAVATSGPAELGVHVTDPHTGRFERAIASATAVTRLVGRDEGAAVADAWATALVAAGPIAPTLLDVLSASGLAGMVVESDGRVHDPRELLGAARRF
jgi:FAD:protein FMN transferase